MSSNDNKKIDTIRGLFEHRHQTYQELTNQISKELSPGLIAALQLLIDLPEDQITWLAISMEEDELIAVSLAVTYNPTDKISQFIARFLDPEEMSQQGQFTEPVQRHVRLLIPIEIAIQTKDEVLDFVSVSMFAAPAKVSEIDSDLLEAELSDEQQASLTLLAYTADPRVKH